MRGARDGSAKHKLFEIRVRRQRCAICASMKRAGINGLRGKVGGFVFYVGLVLAWLRAFLAGTTFGVLTAAAAGTLGAAASIYTAEIRLCAESAAAGCGLPDVRHAFLAEAEAAAMHGIPGPASFPGFGLGWWSLVVTWVFAYALRQGAVKAEHEGEVDRIRGIMLRSPNPSLLDYYPEIIGQLRVVVREGLRDFKANQDPDRIAKAIGECVNLICSMTSQFPQGMARRVYRGNVMLYWRRAEPGERERFGRVKNELVGFPLASQSQSNATIMSEENLRGALELIPALTGTNLDKPEMHKRALDAVPHTSLPVPNAMLSAAGRYNTFPGAPLVVFAEPLNVVPSIKDIEQFCETEMEHPETTRQEVIAYFRVGAGADVRSFLSYRIGDGDSPVGVLNVDCEVENLLGADEQFYLTYRALLDPMVAIMEPLVRRYRDACKRQALALDGAEDSEEVFRKNGGRS